MLLKHGTKNINEIELVAPREFDRVTSWMEVEFGGVGLAA